MDLPDADGADLAIRDYGEDNGMKGKWSWMLGVLVLLLLLPTSVVLADGSTSRFDDGQIFVDEDVALEPGETFNGDLGVFDGSLVVPQGSTVNGDVFVTNGYVDLAGRVNGSLAVINGDLTLAQTARVRGDLFGMSGDQEVAGQVQGDLSVMFGDLVLRSTAVVEGDVMVLSGSLERETGAQVLGDEMPEIPLPPIPFVPERLERRDLPGIPPLPEVPEVPEWTPPTPPQPPQFHRETLGQRIGRFVGRSVAIGFVSLVFIAVGLLMVFIWPRATRRVSDCIAALPLQSFGLGLLTFLIAVVLEVLAVVLMILIILVAAVMIGTVLLIPIGLLLILLSVLVLLPVPLGMIAATVLGWIGLAELIGQRVLKVLGVGNATPAGAVLAGLLVTVPLTGVFWLFAPLCCAWPFIILLTSVGVGAVIHTRFGTQSCRQSGGAGETYALPLDAMDEELGQPDGPMP
jgi:cytoskeletal protein CcmA (bactofilin family)